MNILITGASGGMGRAIVRALADNGHTFFLQHHDARKKLELISEHSNFKGIYHFLSADLTDSDELDVLLDFVDQHGGADSVIHSVSLPTKISGITTKSWNDFEDHLNIQVKSLFQIVKRLTPKMMQKQFGRIIALASEYTVSRPPPKLADYVTAKYAMVGLMKMFAVEFGQFGITSNCISPGLTSTELTRQLPIKLKDIIAQQTPLKRLSTPQDVSALVKFLSSPEASMITGENFLVNGGYVMR